MVRFKNRYLLIRVESVEDYFQKNFTKEDILNVSLRVFADQKLIKETIKDELGEFEVAKVVSSLKLIYFNFDTRMMILRCLRDYIRTVQTAIFFVDSMNDQNIRLRILRNSGTIRKSEATIQDHTFAQQSKNKIRLSKLSK